jgi:ribonuclease R
MNSTLLKDRTRIEGLTIDGSDSQDLDDAFYLEALDDGHILHISIADVGASIETDSLLDKDAQEQCFTRYLRNSNKPMLPHDYSENSLSLLANTARLTITISIPIDASGQAQAPTMSRTILNSQAKLSYEQADQIMATAEHKWHSMLKQCHVFARLLFQQRQKNGAIALYNLQKGLATSEDGSIKTLSADETYNSHIVIQEFMILANSAVAHFFAEHQIPALYRNHTSKAVAPERDVVLEDINNALSFGDQARINTLIKKFTLIFNKAEYAPVIAGHYALNLAAYTHITSPIRRYADLINIRQLSAFIAKKTLPYTQEELVCLGEHINVVTLAYQKNQTQYFKKVEFQKRLQLLNNEELSLAEENNFYPMLQAAVASNKLPPALLDAINSRLQAEELELREIFILLLGTRNTQQWQGLKTQLLYHLGKQLHMASSLVTMASQKLYWQAVSYETKQIDAFPSRFFTTASINIKDKVFISDSQKTLSIYISNKKTSQQLSNLSLLANILDIELDISAAYSTQAGENSDVVDNKIEYPIESSVSINTNINYVGKLVELYQQKAWGAPEYEYAQKGLSHQPLFLMTACIRIAGKQYCSDEKSSCNKKRVKQLASADLIDKIAHLPADTSATCSHTPNFVGILNTLCQQQQLDLPHYEFNYTEDNDRHLGQFKCTCSVMDLMQRRQETHAYGTSKKEAKQYAAKMMRERFNTSK